MIGTPEVAIQPITSSLKLTKEADWAQWRAAEAGQAAGLAAGLVQGSVGSHGKSAGAACNKDTFILIIS